MTNIPVPRALQDAFDRWKDEADGSDRPTRWRRPAWEEFLADTPPLREVLGGWPEALDGAELNRARVTDFAAAVTVDDRPAQLTAFLAAMVWGYGRGGLGPWRVEQMLRQEGFVDDLAELTWVVMEKGGPAAVKHVREQRRGRAFLKYLGPAFGTKYIYFLTKAHPQQATAPILDSVMREWFQQNVDGINVQIGDSWEYPHRYGDYVRALEGWGEALGLAADEVEQVIFEYGADPASEVSPEETLDSLGRWLATRQAAGEAQPHLEALAAIIARCGGETAADADR